MCVCVCVCPSHFLSTRLQVRPRNEFFTVDSLKDVHGFTQGCAFWGSLWWIVTFRGSKFPIIGSISRQICKEFKLLYLPDLCIRLTWNLTGSCGQQQRLRGWSVSYGGKAIPRWRTAAILKIDISPYPSEKSSNFHEILYTAADFELDERHVALVPNENKIAWDRLRVRQNVFLVDSNIFVILSPSNYHHLI